MESGNPVNAKHAQLERRSAHQLGLKAVDMLRSGTQLAKSHGDDLDLEYLWNEDEYSSLENSFKAIEKNAEYRRQQEVLARVHVVERPITVHYESQTKALYLRNFADCPVIDIIIQKNVTTKKN